MTTGGNVEILLPRFKENNVNLRRYIFDIERYLELKWDPEMYKVTIFMQTLEGKSIQLEFHSIHGNE